ncbi:PAS domain S-box protein [Halorubrum vacuolatum]|uniref:histidine kinase n=1 Tax=Halorubrum vacuolatum TaxID=63740 RepID=A0A238VNL4_HALVU|nr:PAS domain S-box protein [Halorubrum vacuolatum]SNR35808.1 PAS domain S-box-containing protein [Halorubrum vacuolatum]
MGDTVRVLYLGDDPAVADLLRQQLEDGDERFVVETASDPEEVASSIDADPPDGVVPASERARREGCGAGTTAEPSETGETGDDELLRQTERLARVGGWEVDVETGEQRWTRGTYAIHGLDPDEPFEPTLEAGVEFYHPDDRERIERATARCIESGEPYEEELRLITADGRHRWVRTSGEPVYEGGEIHAIRGAIQDITDRKERERELHRYEAMLEYSPDLIVVLDEDGTVDYQSPPSPLFDWEPRSLVGETPFEQIHPEDRSRVIDHFERVIAAPEEIDKIELRAEDVNGEWHWVESRAQNFIGREPVDGILAVMRDISERKEYEQELERQTAELEAQYRYLFEEAPIMMVLTRTVDGEPIVDDCNQRFADRLGYRKNEVLDRKLASFYTNESARKLLEDGYSRALSGKLVSADRELLTTEGERVETLLRAVPRRMADGELDGTLAMYVDISRRKAIEREKTRLEEVNRVLSHDLRNPLNVAQGRVRLAIDDDDADPEHLAVVVDALERMERLIEDLLELARTDDAIETERLSLATLAREAWRNVETGESGFRIETDTSVEAERTRVTQLFENLFRNAIEHGDEAVTVTVGELDDGFYIEDTGPGIPEADRERVFEAGYSTNPDGTGLGLGIVKRVCDAHGWTVRVTAGTDGGARFEIRDVGPA